MLEDGKDGSAGRSRADETAVTAQIAETAATAKIADERGITLQTLIITAVLVLMAVVAGVVIIALTGSSSDDLEESGSELEGRCNSVEIFDPEVAARGEKGENYANVEIRRTEGGTTTTELVRATFQSERIGCIPVCVWVNTGPGDTDQRLDPGEVQFHRNRFDGTIYVENNPAFFNVSQFIFSGNRGEIATYAGDPAESRVIKRGDTVWNFSSTIGVAPEIDRIAVAPNQSECHTYDASGNVLLG